MALAGQLPGPPPLFSLAHLIYRRYGWRGWKREAEAQETATVRGAGGLAAIYSHVADRELTRSFSYGWRGWKREAEPQETATVRGAGG